MFGHAEVAKLSGLDSIKRTPLQDGGLRVDSVINKEVTWERRSQVLHISGPCNLPWVTDYAPNQGDAGSTTPALHNANHIR